MVRMGVRWREWESVLLNAFACRYLYFYLWVEFRNLRKFMKLSQTNQ